VCNITGGGSILNNKVFLLFIAFAALQPASADSFVVGDVEASRGHQASGYLAVPPGVDDGTKIPITIVHGAGDGPVLALIAGTHGYEYPGITALQRVRKSLDPREVSGTIIISAGGKEIGSKGQQIEEEIKKEALKGGIRIIGPNCMGIVSVESKLNATFASLMPLPGRLAFISQSGAICAAILDLSLKEGIGFRYFVSIGSMLDVDFGDLVDYLGHDPEVSSIVLYMEKMFQVKHMLWQKCQKR